METKITSLQNNLIKDLYKLKTKKISLEKGLFLIEGTNVIKEAIDANIVKQILYVDNNFDFYNSIQVTPEIISRLSNLTSSQGAIAVCFHMPTEIKKNNRVLVLDGINIPNNVGAMIRSALAFNFDGVVISNDSSYPYNPKCIFSSQGAIFKIPVVQTDIKEYLNNSKSKIFITTLSDKSISFNEINEEEKMIFVMGSESNGVSKEIQKISENHIKINISNIDSLNVSVAAGIILHKYKI